MKWYIECIWNAERVSELFDTRAEAYEAFIERGFNDNYGIMSRKVL